MTGLFVFMIICVVISLAIAAGVHWFEESTVLTTVALLVCLALTAGLSLLNWATTYRNDHWATCHVTGKDRGADDGSYRIYTDDCGQLGNEDSLLRWKFNSADYWQEIPDEGVVRFRIAGSRWGFMSQFPNVFDVEEIKQSS